jgi:hypothetical protein
MLQMIFTILGILILIYVVIIIFVFLLKVSFFFIFGRCFVCVGICKGVFPKMVGMDYTISISYILRAIYLLRRLGKCWVHSVFSNIGFLIDNCTIKNFGKKQFENIA